MVSVVLAAAAAVDPDPVLEAALALVGEDLEVPEVVGAERAQELEEAED